MSKAIDQEIIMMMITLKEEKVLVIGMRTEWLRAPNLVNIEEMIMTP